MIEQIRGLLSSEFKRILNGCFLVARAQEILEEIFYEMLLRKKSIIGSSEFKRMFFGCASARNLGGNLL